MIQVGHVVAATWGLDEYEATVVEVYSSGGRDRVRLTLPESLTGSPEPCPCCGRQDDHQETISVPVDTIQLLPCKPFGLWLKKARRRS